LDAAAARYSLHQLVELSSLADYGLIKIGKNSNSMSAGLSPGFSTLMIPRPYVARTVPGDTSKCSPYSATNKTFVKPWFFTTK
jgi:hypothetical protein